MPSTPDTRFQLPTPPPPLHTRSSNVAMALDDQHTPGTPTRDCDAEFYSPMQTPQGSPSKSHMPPGAYDLPNIFANALKLQPTQGQPNSPKALQTTQAKSTSPNKALDDPFSAQEQAKAGALPGSPLRKQGKENTPPPASYQAQQSAQRPALQQGNSYLNQQSQAALSRQDQYRSRGEHSPTRTEKSVVGVGGALTAEDMEKLNKPAVKRLANVTQLYFLDYYFDLLSYTHARQKRLDAFKTHVSPTQPDHDQLWKDYQGRERALLRSRRTKMGYGDFQILTQIGQGGYGSVFLACKRDTREVCALKVMRKKLLFKLDEVRHVLTERDILTTAKSDWLVRLLYAFQDESSIYLAMEYVPGGDFRTLLNNTGVLHNRHARFYISEMFLCVDALHTLGYIHRDLKPENFLIDGTGKRCSVSSSVSGHTDMR
jgi:cell cycle protein kinase DBF2